jgi:hypothetical protein
MENRNFYRGVIFNNAVLQFMIFLLMIVLLGNLNAIVDSFFHPEIPYFDEEHLLVGGITALVSSILIGIVILYARHLEQALHKIEKLEEFLPICAGCKKIRIRNADGAVDEVWQPVESYLAEKTNAQLTHSICPDCLAKLYPEYAQPEAGPQAPADLH